MTGRTGLLILVLACTGVLSSSATQQKATSTAVRATVDHTPFTHLLRQFVDEQGDVDYDALQSAPDTALVPYLRQLSTAKLDALSRDERLALWINAYNAYTLKLIVDHYPVTSIWEIEPASSTGSPFQIPVGEVADTVRTLDQIEHEIIRERFDEPRIHFALVCAAKSCPRLRQEAYTADRLDEQLTEQARRFLHHERKNQIPADEETVALSPIFKWYGTDFGSTLDAVQRFSAPFFPAPIRDALSEAAYEIRFLSYDWTLNDQALSWGDSDAEPPSGS